MSDQPGQAVRRERLEVPPTSRLERRLLVGDTAPQRSHRKPTIKPLPQSQLLGRLQAFLPALEAANTSLEQQLAAGQPQDEVAMERGSDDEQAGPYVELDLACGLFDLKDASAVEAAERSLAGQGVAVEAFDGGSSSSDSDSEEEEEAEGGAGGGAAASGAGGGGDAMQEDGPAGAAASGANRSAAEGRRRQPGKLRGGRHAGIQEL